jgi:hypothetical protein
MALAWKTYFDSKEDEEMDKITERGINYSTIKYFKLVGLPSEKFYRKRKLIHTEFQFVEKLRENFNSFKIPGGLDEQAMKLRIANELAMMYWEISQLYIVDFETQLPITRNDFIDCLWDDMELTVDGFVWRDLFGMPLLT